MALTVVLAIVSKTDDVSLACTTSLLRLQQHAARREDIALDVHIVGDLLEALNIGRGDYIVTIDAQCGFPVEFIFGLLDSGHKVVAGVYPLPRVDWDRVKKTLESESKEPLGHSGNVYNLTPVLGGGLQRYAPVKEVKELRVLAIATSVLAEMAGPCNSFGDGKYLYCHDSVYEDVFQNPYQTLVRKLPSDVRVMADLDMPCVLSAPAQFAGCVGMRGFVR